MDYHQKVAESAKKHLRHDCWWDVNRDDIPQISLFMAAEEVASEMIHEERLAFLGLEVLLEAQLTKTEKRQIKDIVACVLRETSKKPD